MTARFDPPEPPNAFVRWLFRVPVFFFRAGLGWLFGSRIILLEHVGRKSGLTRYSCVEVVDRDDDGMTLTIVSGYGVRAQWYQNLRRPAVGLPLNRLHDLPSGTCRALTPNRAPYPSRVSSHASIASTITVESVTS
jgi:deazaflavin-dependent oxidoreductase (nitroreductase family)